MLMKNVSGEDLLVPAAMLVDSESYATRHVVIPKDEVFDCRLGYCVPGLTKSGSRAPSLLERATMKDTGTKNPPRRVEPADPDILQLWLKAPKTQWHAGKPDPYRAPPVAGAPQVYKGKRQAAKAQPVQEK